MWPDIKKMNLFDETPEILKKLPRTSERFNALYYFATHTPHEWSIIHVDRNRQLQIKSWLNWAALVAFPNPSCDDPLQKDLEYMGLAERWEKSEEKQNLYADPLIAVILELRNYEVHFELRTGIMKEFQVFYGSTSRLDGAKKIVINDEVFIAQIDYKLISRTRNIVSGKSAVSAEMVNWFNHQISIWPAGMLLLEAKGRFCFFVAEFLKINGVA